MGCVSELNLNGIKKPNSYSYIDGWRTYSNLIVCSSMFEPTIFKINEYNSGVKYINMSKNWL